MGISTLVGVDLGQSQDYSTLVVLERTQQVQQVQQMYEEGTKRYLPAEYVIRAARRWELGTAYPRIVEDIAGLLARLAPDMPRRLVVDGTGVGRPIVDLLAQQKLRPIAVSLHGGKTATQVNGTYWNVGKAEVVSSLVVCSQTRRLGIAEGLSYRDILAQELATLDYKVNLATAHETYAAWREKDHDDLVLATAVAVWWGERSRGEGGMVKVAGY